MRQTTLHLMVGYGVFCAVNYAIRHATAGTLRYSGQNPVISVNDFLTRFNVLTYVLPEPTAPLNVPASQVVQTPDDVVTAPASNVVAFPG